MDLALPILRQNYLAPGSAENYLASRKINSMRLVETFITDQAGTDHL